MEATKRSFLDLWMDILDLQQLLDEARRTRGRSRSGRKKEGVKRRGRRLKRKGKTWLTQGHQESSKSDYQMATLANHELHPLIMVWHLIAHGCWQPRCKGTRGKKGAGTRKTKPKFAKCWDKGDVLAPLHQPFCRIFGIFSHVGTTNKHGHTRDATRLVGTQPESIYNTKQTEKKEGWDNQVPDRVNLTPSRLVSEQANNIAYLIR